MTYPSIVKASRELDTEVAKKVMAQLEPEGDIHTMGLGMWPGSETWLWGISTAKWEWYYRGPAYSTDISATWKVVEKMRKQVSLEVAFELFVNESGWWEARFGMEDFVCADTAPLAICLAALKAVAVEMEDVA